MILILSNYNKSENRDASSSACPKSAELYIPRSSKSDREALEAQIRSQRTEFEEDLLSPSQSSSQSSPRTTYFHSYNRSRGLHNSNRFPLQGSGSNNSSNGSGNVNTASGFYNSSSSVFSNRSPSNMSSAGSLNLQRVRRTPPSIFSSTPSSNTANTATTTTTTTTNNNNNNNNNNTSIVGTAGFLPPPTSRVYYSPRYRNNNNNNNLLSFGPGGGEAASDAGDSSNSSMSQALSAESPFSASEDLLDRDIFLSINNLLGSQQLSSLEQLEELMLMEAIRLSMNDAPLSPDVPGESSTGTSSSNNDLAVVLADDSPAVRTHGLVELESLYSAAEERRSDGSPLVQEELEGQQGQEYAKAEHRTDGEEDESFRPTLLSDRLNSSIAGEGEGEGEGLDEDEDEDDIDDGSAFDSFKVRFRNGNNSSTTSGTTAATAGGGGGGGGLSAHSRNSSFGSFNNSELGGLILAPRRNSESPIANRSSASHYYSSNSSTTNSSTGNAVAAGTIANHMNNSNGDSSAVLIGKLSAEELSAEEDWSSPLPDKDREGQVDRSFLTGSSNGSGREHFSGVCTPQIWDAPALEPRQEDHFSASFPPSAAVPLSSSPSPFLPSSSSFLDSLEEATTHCISPDGTNGSANNNNSNYLNEKKEKNFSLNLKISDGKYDHKNEVTVSSKKKGENSHSKSGSADLLVSSSSTCSLLEKIQMALDSPSSAYLRGDEHNNSNNNNNSNQKAINLESSLKELSGKYSVVTPDNRHADSGGGASLFPEMTVSGGTVISKDSRTDRTNDESLLIEEGLKSARESRDEFF